jgi:diguanylate cyclase (GGDEF)-like protein/PAS domain S-box-containing protein
MPSSLSPGGISVTFRRSGAKRKPTDESVNLQQALAESEQRLQHLIALSSDYYWEQDERCRFTVFRLPRHLELAEAPQNLLHKKRWELGGVPVSGAASWSAHKAVLSAHKAFFDLVVRYPVDKGPDLYISTSGLPLVDPNGRFRGYCGVSKNVTQAKREEQYLGLERDVALSLNDTDDVSGALAAALRAICELERWDSGRYWSFDEKSGAMALHGGWSGSGTAIRGPSGAGPLTFAPDGGSVEIVWRSRKPLWTEDLCGARPRPRQIPVHKTGSCSAFLFPVHSKGRPVGVLEFNSRYIPDPDACLLNVITTLAAYIGSFCEQANTFARLRESEERYASTVELAAIGIGHVDEGGRFIHVNRQLCEMLGYSRDELLALTVRQVSHPDDTSVTDNARSRLRAGEIESFKTEKRYLRKDGTTVWVGITVAAKRDSNGAILYDISIVEDISDRKRAEERVQYLATHDEMTNLPNRAMFLQLLTRAIESARRRNRKAAVLFIDLDRFKIVNDCLGHAAGDALLKEIASRFKSSLRASDVVARLGGDEFVVLVDDIEDVRSAATTARKVLLAALKPVELMGQECRVTASIGIAVFPKDGDDAVSLMKNADLAMYLAKEEGKNNFQAYSRDISTSAIEKLKIETHLRHALERNEFTLQYQAKVNMATQEITGVEALLRWWNRDLGTVSPTQFIPIAEDIGLIVPIGKWVLKTACAQNVAWRKQGLPPVCMCVNVSPRQFMDANIVSDIRSALAESGMPGELLELEITEGVIMQNVNQAIGTLNAIKKMGVRLAIDDFGTGYSSLAQLKLFPIDTLKVDRSFIREITVDAEDRAITEAIVAMGRSLGVRVVAEGVETAEQEAFLKSLACDEMQGFYFSKPAHPDEFAELLRKPAEIPRKSHRRRRPPAKVGQP